MSEPTNVAIRSPTSPKPSLPQSYNLIESYLSEHAVLVRAREAQKRDATIDVLSKWHLSDRRTVWIKRLEGRGPRQVHLSLREAGNRPTVFRRKGGPWEKPREEAPAALGGRGSYRLLRDGALSRAAGSPKAGDLLVFFLLLPQQWFH